MAVLRFPNAVSDVPRFLDVFRILFEHLTVPNFGQDDISRTLIDHGQVSSSGAVGEEALVRSTREDRSRDSLYNQSKAYSELFRMLGWMHPGSDSSHFVYSGVAKYIAVEKLTSSLIQESFYSIVFPNPHVENRGGHVLRPIVQLLIMMRHLEGVISRDEIIVGVLSLMNDRTATATRQQVEELQAIRGRLSRLHSALGTARRNLKETTVQNYTRIPIGVIRALGWTVRERVAGKYEKPVHMDRLTPIGEKLADELMTKVDVRHSDIANYEDEERAAFVVLSQFAMFDRAGYDVSEVKNSLPMLASKCHRILRTIGTDDFAKILYSPFQQTPAVDLRLAQDLDETLV